MILKEKLIKKEFYFKNKKIKEKDNCMKFMNYFLPFL